MSLEDVMTAPEETSSTMEPKPVYKSWKKKYRKLRHQFDQRMRESDQLFKEETKATETARRLVEENDQLLDLLLDVNECIRLPPETRFDLQSPTSEPPSLSAVPPLESDGRAQSTGRPVEELQTSLEEDKKPPKLEESSSNNPKSFASLVKTTSHTTISITPDDLLPPDLTATSPPPTSYFSPTHEEEYLFKLDTSLINGASTPPVAITATPTKASKALPQPANPSNSSTTNVNPAGNLDREKETNLSLRNPVSVYNWLRRHQPQVFLQDNEGPPEKSGAKSSRGAGKRASTAATATVAAGTAAAATAKSAVEPVEFIDEDGIVYGGVAEVGGSGTGIAKGKRKKDEDGGYRPKGGSGGGSRLGKRKKEAGGASDTAGGSAPKRQKKNSWSTQAAAATVLGGGSS
ncbi:MAG: hypothetical protein M1837_005324 [Sclerophora amabilis]|nr:MAG: hypothetical protein M1837_005324 [Sclerophora amabilis]